MRVVFMGSPEFGLPTLQMLAIDHQLVLVVSQPDRPAGRSRKTQPPPVAAFARAQGLPLYQPENLRGEAALAPLRDAAPELIVVAAFGLLLPSTVLELPAHGCLNVHPSLLPRYRGASPVQAALLNGDRETGVSIIKLTQRMDAGPILAQSKVDIERDDDASTLESKLAEIGAGLLVEAVDPWVRGQLSTTEQDETEASYCPRLTRADAELVWSRPAIELTRKVRAFRGRGEAFTDWQGRILKVLKAEPLERIEPRRPPGLVFVDTAEPAGSGAPLVAAGAGAVALLELALEGKSATSGRAFLNGYRAIIGARLGSKGEALMGLQEGR